MPTKLDELFFEITVKKGAGADQAIAQFSGQLKATDKKATQAASSVKGYSKATEKAGKTSSRTATAIKRLVIAMGGLLILRKVVTAMTRFETSIAEIGTIAQGGAKQVKELEKGVLALAKTLPQSAEELGAGAYELLSAGVTDTADIFAVLEVSAKAAVAGLTNTAVAVDAITTIMNAFGFAASEAGRIADVLFRTVDQGKVRFEELASQIGGAATTAALAGVTFEELAAGVSTLTIRGTFAAEAITSLNRLFLTLTSQTTTQEAAFKRLGIEFSVAAVKEKGFAFVLSEVNKLTAGQIEALSDLFPNIRAARAAFVLAGDAADEYARQLERAKNSTGATEVAFQIMNKTADNQAKILRNNVIVTFQEIGQSVLPGVAKAFGFLSDVINRFVTAIKFIGVEFAVIEKLDDVVAQSIKTAFTKAFDFMVFHVQGVIDLATRGIAGLANLAKNVPGLAQISRGALAAAEGLQSQFRILTNLSGVALINAEKKLEEEKKALAFVREAADEERQTILRESKFVRLRLERNEAEKAAAAERQIIARLTEEQLERRLELEQQLARQVSAVTLSSAEKQIEIIKKLKEEYIAEFGELSEGIAEQFLKIEEAAEKAFSREKAETLAREFITGLTSTLADLEREFQPIELELASVDRRTEEGRARAVELEAQLSDKIRQQVVIYESVVRLVQERLEAEETTTEEAEALKRVLLQIVRSLISAKEKARGLKGELEGSADATNEMWQNLQKSVHLLNTAVTGALELADALGLVDEKTKEVLQGLQQAAVGGATLAAGIATGNAAAIVGGALGLAGGITKALGGILGGDDEAKRIQVENTEALRQLRRSLAATARAFLSGITGIEFDRLRGAERALGQVVGPGLFTGTGSGGFKRGQVNLEDLDPGIADQVRDIINAAKELGIVFKDETKPTFDELRKAMGAINGAAANLSNSFRDFEGRMKALSLEFELFDIDNPQEQLERLFVLFKQMTRLPDDLKRRLAAIDLSTVEGRRELEKLIQELFLRITQGKLPTGALGELTLDEILSLIGDLERLIDDIDLQTGTTQDVRRSIQITEIQAGQLLAFQSTLVFRAEERNIILAHILTAITGETPIAPPTIPAEVGTAGGTTFNITVGPNEFTLGNATIEADASEFVEEIAEQLGEKFKDLDALLGGQP